MKNIYIKPQNEKQNQSIFADFNKLKLNYVKVSHIENINIPKK